MKRIARVFPRKTKASPTDALAFFDVPDMFVEADEVHISVAFTWDLQRAEELAQAWSRIAPVQIGGPAFNRPGAEFIQGMYVAPGYTVTSRGCPNKCWFCAVPKREPALVELPIVPGHNLLDDNILACSERHIREVFSMLSQQRGPKGGRKVEFTGGLEAARLRAWHVELLTQVRPAQMFFALDTPDDEEPLRNASRMLLDAGFTRQQMRCYVLIGFPRDTFDEADSRLRLCVSLGFFPLAMLWRDQKGDTSPEWRKFQRLWARPAIINARMKACAADHLEGLQTAHNTGNTLQSLNANAALRVA